MFESLISFQVTKIIIPAKIMVVVIKATAI